MKQVESKDGGWRPTGTGPGARGGTRPDLRLGLIGDNIVQSRSPLLHRLAGRQRGLKVAYDLLIPRELGKSFNEVFEHCRAEGYRGINVTYPYKEKVTAKLTIDDPLVRSIGAVNTVLFAEEGPKGFNTDYSGFIAAYRTVRGDEPPGAVCMVGAGGVGRAIAFGLVALGMERLHLVDQNPDKAEGLAADLKQIAPHIATAVHRTAGEAALGVNGLINSTPIGMVGYEGSVFRGEAMRGKAWAFDAVYTPVDTHFLRDAESAGLNIISGYELFFFQGVHAWDIFTGFPLDHAQLRRTLLEAG